MILNGMLKMKTEEIFGGMKFDVVIGNQWD